MFRRLFATALLLLLVVTAPACAHADKHRADSSLRMMSFNIRTGTALDGMNSWPFRMNLLMRTIESADPDLLGLQEVLPFQGEQIKEHFKDSYAFVGVPRNDGKRKGEMAAVMFRRGRFDKVRDGTFWLSETPDVVGSKGWDAQIPRVVTWVELRDRRSDGRTLYFFNTHFDHKGGKARFESAGLMRRRMQDIAGEKPIVVTGDFNTAAGGEPFRRLTGTLAKEPNTWRVLRDSYGELHPAPTTQDFTFHGFTGHSTNPHPTRIDWILHTDDLVATKAEIDRYNEDGRYPSDHFPVTAELKWSSATARPPAATTTTTTAPAAGAAK